MARLLAVLIALASATLAAGAVKVPDLRTGNVNGLRGILLWPADLPAANGDPRPLETAEGCDVHLVALDDLDRELTYPCGKWFALPAAGRYDHWLETNGAIGPMGMLYYARQPFEGVGMAAIIPLAPAGRVVIPKDRSLPEPKGLRLVSVETRHPLSSRVFDRRLTSANAHTPVQMPEGRVLVGRFDRKTNDAIALSKPIDIAPGRTAEVWPAPAAAGEAEVWTLDAPAEPLTVMAKERVAGAFVALWLDGVKLSGPPLSFATWSVLATNRDGVWTGRNLPPKPVRLLLLAPAAATSSAFDAVAQRVDYPWPAAVMAAVRR